MPNYLSRPLTPVAGPTAVPNNSVPNLPSNTYQLLSGLADAFDRVNKKLNTHADKLHTIKNSTNSAVGEVISTSKGQVTDTLSDVWNNSTTDLNTAHDQLSTITTYQGGLGYATDFRNTLEASKTTIQTGLIAQENLQNQQSGRAAPVSPEQMAQWQQDIQALDNTINNINMVIEAMTMMICSLNSGFSYSCATGFVPGGPLPNFPKNSFAHQMSDGSSGSGNDPITRIENSITTTGGKEEDAMALILNAEGAGVDLNVIADLLDKGISADTINSSMGDISNLLDKGATSDTITSLFQKGLDLAGINNLVEAGAKLDDVQQWLKDDKITNENLGDLTTLATKGVSGETITQLLNNNADLSDIAKNITTLRDGNVRPELINNWLKNKTNLNDAVAIMNQGADLNLIGTGNVGNFTGLKGASVNDVLSRIPADANIQKWTPDGGGATDGMKFRWNDASRNTWNLRMHGPDVGAPEGSNASSGWILRVKRGSYFMDADGNFYKDTIQNRRSTNYNPAAINATHIPIQEPLSTSTQAEAKDQGPR